MNDLVLIWRDEITAELGESREALAEATAAAQQATERHQGALAAMRAVRAAPARLPGLESSLTAPIAGRIAAAAAEAQTAGQAARRALLDRQEAGARVARLETAEGQLAAVLAAVAEPALEVA